MVTPTEAKAPPVVDVKTKFAQMFKTIDKTNKYSSVLSASPLSVIKGWIDTGSYALNAVMSGSIKKGVPQGRIVGFYGPSGTGKTLIMTKIAANFQKMNPDNWVFIFDSENAVDMNTCVALGANPSRIKHIPVETVEETRNTILPILDEIIESGLQGRVLIIIDSLGNLASNKEHEDSQKGKTAVDMGNRAKQLKSMLRVLTSRAAKANTTVLFSNHEYADPTAMYESIVKSQSGGEGPIYMATVLCQLSATREKNEGDHEHDQILSAAKKISGLTLRALMTKNRIVPPFLVTEMYLNFITGLDKYSGCFDLAQGLGLITGEKKYAWEGVSVGFRKDFERNPAFWEGAKLDRLDEEVKKKFSFSDSSSPSNPAVPAVPFIEEVEPDEDEDDEDDEDETTNAVKG